MGEGGRRYENCNTTTTTLEVCGTDNGSAKPKFEPRHNKIYKVACPPSLTSVFAFRNEVAKTLSNHLSAHRRLSPD